MWTSGTSAGHRPACAALVELLCQMHRLDPGTRHADRYALVESSAGEQCRGDRRIAAKFDPSHGSENPIYTPEGGWSYQRFEQWLVCTGVSAWPRLDSGRLNVDSDAFRMMY